MGLSLSATNVSTASDGTSPDSDVLSVSPRSAPSMGRGKLGQIFGTNSCARRIRGQTLTQQTLSGRLAVTLALDEPTLVPSKRHPVSFCVFLNDHPVFFSAVASSTTFYLTCALGDSLRIGLCDPKDLTVSLASGSLTLSPQLPFGTETIMSVDLDLSPDAAQSAAAASLPRTLRVTLLPINFGVYSYTPPVEDTSELAEPNLLDIDLLRICDVPLNLAEQKARVCLLVAYGSQSLVSRKADLDPATCAASIESDLTFRASPQHTFIWIRMVSLVDSAVVNEARISLLDIHWSASMSLEGRWFPFSAGGFVKMRLQLSEPGNGSCIHASLGTPISAVPLRFNYGDILLFNNRGAASVAVSMATSSSWDHAALVYQEENGALMVVEATSEGVKGHPLEEKLAEWTKRVKKIALRRLYVKRDDESRRALWQFCMEMCGRRYKKSLSSLMSSRLGLHRGDDLSTLFCSELVAAGLKVLGALPQSVSASNVLPKDLASSSSLKLLKGSLGPLITISNLKKSFVAGTPHDDY